MHIWLCYKVCSNKVIIRWDHEQPKLSHCHGKGPEALQAIGRKSPSGHIYARCKQNSLNSLLLILQKQLKNQTLLKMHCRKTNLVIWSFFDHFPLQCFIKWLYFYTFESPKYKCNPCIMHVFRIRADFDSQNNTLVTPMLHEVLFKEYAMVIDKEMQLRFVCACIVRVRKHTVCCWCEMQFWFLSNLLRVMWVS